MSANVSSTVLGPNHSDPGSNPGRFTKSSVSTEGMYLTSRYQHPSHPLFHPAIASWRVASLCIIVHHAILVRNMRDIACCPRTSCVLHCAHLSFCLAAEERVVLRTGGWTRSKSRSGALAAMSCGSCNMVLWLQYGAVAAIWCCGCNMVLWSLSGAVDVVYDCKVVLCL